MYGAEWCSVIPSRSHSSSIADLPPPRGAAVNTAPLSVSSEAGWPWAAAALWNEATTSAALNTTRASEATRNLE